VTNKPITMAELSVGVSGIDLDSFRRRHGEAFLLFTGQPTDLRQATREWQATLGDRGRKVGGSAPQRLNSIVVFPLRSSSEPWSVTVGRVEPNDVVIADESVSVYHAVFKRGRGGRIFLQDTGSKNGTYINEAHVPAKAEGAMEVRSSNMVRLGSVILTFLLASEVHDLARTLGAVTAASPASAASGLDEQLFADVKPTMTGKVPLSDNLLAYFDAVQFVRNKRFRSAQLLLREILSRDPGNRNALVWLHIAEARQLTKEGNLDAAASRYRAILALDPRHDEALRELRQLERRRR